MFYVLPRLYYSGRLYLLMLDTCTRSCMYAKVYRMYVDFVTRSLSISTRSLKTENRSCKHTKLKAKKLLLTKYTPNYISSLIYIYFGINKYDDSNFHKSLINLTKYCLDFVYSIHILDNICILHHPTLIVTFFRIKV